MGASGSIWCFSLSVVICFDVVVVAAAVVVVVISIIVYPCVYV